MKGEDLMRTWEKVCCVFGRRYSVSIQLPSFETWSHTDAHLDPPNPHNQAPNNNPAALAKAKTLWEKVYGDTATKCIHAARGEVCYARYV